MHTAAGMIDLHARTHRSLKALLDHCAGFAPDALDRELDGFGYPSIATQLQHVIGAEAYWIGVLRGEMLVEEDPADRASVDALRRYRERVASETEAYLASLSDAELSTPRRCVTWGGKEHDLVPAHVVLRTQTHAFQHQGQIAAMCRLLGRPVPAGLDFPLRPA